MRILVDADSCPAKHIIEKVGKKYSLSVIMYCDVNHILNFDYAEVIYVDSGFQSADMAIINAVQKKDIVITGDFGVAAMALGKKAFSINSTGRIYDDDNIERLLFERHISSKVRRSGGKTSNLKKRTSKDDERLMQTLEKVIVDNL